MNKNKAHTLLILTLMLMFITSAQSTVVRFETNVGKIDIELYEEDAPITVDNFLNYVNRGDYDGTVIHRLSLFQGISIFQGGGYTFDNGSFDTVATDSPITLEAVVSNTEGTIAMARTNSPNTATNQWFINLIDNTNLDAGGGNAGYAVFGKVIRGMDVVNSIGSLSRVNLSSNIGLATGEFPLYRYYGGIVDEDNMIKIERAFVLSDVFQINAGLSGAYFNPATDGQGIYLEVLPDSNQVIMAWFTYDTTNPDESTPSEIGYAGGRWVTAIGSFDGDVFTGTVYESSGGLFDDPTAVSSTPVGTVTLIFNSCSELVMDYSLYDSTYNGMNTLFRISTSNVALCEQLASDANPGIDAQ